MEATPRLTEIWTDGSRPDVAVSRLQYAAGLIYGRRKEVEADAGARYVGDTFRVHLTDNVSALVVDDVTRGLLETCALYGERFGVVVLVYAPSRSVAARMLAGSAPLLDAFDKGVSVRLVETRGAPGLASTDVTRAADAALSAAQLVVGQSPAELAAALSTALDGDSVTSRAALAAALRATADMIAPTPGELAGK